MREIGRSAVVQVVGTLCAGAVLAGAYAGAARGEQTVKITSAGFSPDRLGVPANVFGSATIGSTNLPVTLDLRGTGTCTAAALENIGPGACPANSRAGFGGGVGVYEIGQEIVEEPFTLDFFLGDNRPGHTVLLIFLEGSSPVSIQLVFTAPVIPSPKPYGLGFSVNVPLIKVLPEASDASAKGSFLSLGAKNVAYFRRVHGKRKLLKVRGIVTPKSCPRGGWPVAARFSFEDGSSVLSTSKIPCPR
jgi:hypothetical protein